MKYVILFKNLYHFVSNLQKIYMLQLKFFHSDMH